jgi:hypothetical protein
MALWDPWNRTSGSDAKLNLMTLVSGTGAELAALDKTKHRLVACTSTGSGFTIDHVYLFSTDGTTSIDISATDDHTHAAAGDGGLLTDVLSASPTLVILQLINTDDLKKAQWIETVTGTGSIEDATDGTTGERSIRLRPNGTSGSGATISYPNLKVEFARRSFFQTKLQIETATSIALHAGVGADDVTAADSNTLKYQAEVCTTTNNNWWLRTATGAAQSGSDSGIAISANRVGVKMEHYPLASTPHVDLYIDANSAFQKTSNIPVSGQSTNSNVVKVSVKNNTAADRPLKFYGARLTYKVTDSWV